MQRYSKTGRAAALLAALCLLAGCGRLVTQEFPTQTRLQQDAQQYIEAQAGDRTLFYTLTENGTQYDRAAGEVAYDCTVQYAWSEASTVFSDAFVLHYALDERGDWTLAACDSEQFAQHLANQLEFYSLFYESVSLPESLHAQLHKTRDEFFYHDLQSSKITMFSHTFHVPASFRSLIADGWELAPGSEYTLMDTLDANAYGMLDIQKNGVELTAYIVNASDAPVLIGESVWGGFLLESATDEILLPSDISTGSTAQQIVAAYGEPQKRGAAADGSDELTYYTNDATFVKFTAGAAGTVIEMRNFYDYPLATLASGLFDSYKFDFSLLGSSYRLPCTLETMLNDGWRVAGGGVAGTLDWYEAVPVTLERGGVEVDVTLTNLAASSMRSEYCSVTAVDCAAPAAAGLKLLPSGDYAGASPVTAYTSAASVIALIGEPTAIGRDDAGLLTMRYLQDGANYITLHVRNLTSATPERVEICAGGESEETVFSAVASDIYVDGKEYTLPVRGERLAKDGWELGSGWQEHIGAGTWTKGRLENDDGETFEAFFVNPTRETLTMEEAYVAGAVTDGRADVTLGDGAVEVGMDRAQVYRALGLPDASQDDTDVYWLDEDRFVQLDVSGDKVTAARLVYFSFEKIAP